MRAIVFDRYGPPDVLREADISEPVVGSDDVLVAIRATSVNPVDCKIRQGYQRTVNPQRFPAVPGMDLSGEVLEVGPNVVGFAPGDEVWASPHFRRAGTFAERIAVRSAEKEGGARSTAAFLRNTSVWRTDYVRGDPQPHGLRSFFC